MTSTNERVRAMLATALEMEEQGRAFYERTIQACSNDLGREIFAMLMKDEIVHVDRIKAIAASVGDGVWTDLWRKAGEGHDLLVPFFRELARKAGPRIRAETRDLEALEVGIDFEQRSVQFYREQLAQASDPLERAFLERMVAEEQSHFDVLTDMQYYLSNPAAYLAEQERSGLDGA